MPLERKQKSQKKEADWFYFSAPLMNVVCSDYISLRLLYFLEPLTTSFTILPKMVEVAEKSLKLYVLVNNKSKTALTDSRSYYGHNIEKLRLESASFNSIFDDNDIKQFTRYLSDRGGSLYQFLRYGSQETTDGMSANLEKLIPIIDKIFFKSLILLPEPERKLLNFVCILKSLLTQSNFDQSQYKELLIKSLTVNNEFINEYLELCKKLDEDHKALRESFNIKQ